MAYMTYYKIKKRIVRFKKPTKIHAIYMNGERLVSSPNNETTSVEIHYLRELKEVELR